MFIATVDCVVNYDEETVFATGSTLKYAYAELKENLSNMEAEAIDDNDITFYEAEMIQVEFQITRKEVVTSTPKPVGNKLVASKK